MPDLLCLHSIKNSVKASQNHRPHTQTACEGITKSQTTHRPRVLNEVDQVRLEMQQHGAVAAVLVESFYDEFFEVSSCGVGVCLEAGVPRQSWRRPTIRHC